MKSRVLAAIIDGFLFLVLVVLLMPSLLGYLTRNGNFFGGIYFPFIIIFLYYFLIDFVFFTSPGKWLYNLKITTTNYHPPARYKILLRSFMKVFVLFSGIGIIIMCISLLSNREPFYDTAQGLTISRTDL